MAARSSCRTCSRPVPPARAVISSATASSWRRTSRSSFTWPTSGIMIFGWSLMPSFATFARRLQDRARLHDVDLGEDAGPAGSRAVPASGSTRASPPPPAAACASPPALPVVALVVLQPRHLDQQLLVARQELVQRRIDQADDDGIALAGLGIAHRAEDALEVGALEGQQLVERRLPLLLASARGSSPARSAGAPAP